MRSQLRLVLALVCLSIVFAAPLFERKVIRDGVEMTLDEAEAYDLKKADDTLAAGNASEALKLYEKFLADFPRSGRVPAAMLGLGQSAYRLELYSRADKTFNDLIARYPRSPEAAGAAWGLALMAVKDGRCDQASQHLKQYRGQAEGKLRDQMTLMLADCARKGSNPASALVYYGEEVRDGRDEELKKKARGLAEEVIRELPDEEIASLAREAGKDFPGDLILLEQLKRDAASARFTEAAADADRFRAGYASSHYLEEFRRFERLLERWLRVKPERIGVMLPLTGPAGPIGEQALKGIMLAAGILETVKPSFLPELIVRDTGNESIPVEKIVEELAEEEVIAIIGPLHKRQAERAGLKAQELGVPLISLSPGEDIASIGPLVYQNCLTRREQTQALAEYAVNKMGIKTFGIYYPADDAGRDFADLFTRAVTERGASVVASESYDPTKTDFRASIKALKAQRDRNKFQALFIPDAWTRIAQIAPQLRFMNLNVPLLGTSSWHSEQLLTQVQAADVEGAVFADGIAPEAQDPAFMDFSRRYLEAFGNTPGIIDAQAYETTDLLISLLGNYNLKNREQLHETLDHLENRPGILGEITIDDQGKFRKPLYIIAIKEKKFQVVN